MFFGQIFLQQHIFTTVFLPHLKSVGNLIHGGAFYHKIFSFEVILELISTSSNVHIISLIIPTCVYFVTEFALFPPS